jgi:hypothetical protein
MITDTFHEDQYTVLNIPRPVLLRTRNVPYKTCRENQNTHFTFNNILFEDRAVYEIMLENIAEPDRTQIKIWRKRNAC